MKFRYRKFRLYPDLKFCLRPVIRIEVIHKNNKLETFALIDSGADFCLFQGSIGKYIGLDVASGEKKSLLGIKQEPVLIYFHNILLRISGQEIPCYTGFSFDLEKLPYGILGQNGFFNQYKVILDYKKEIVELEMY